MAMAIAVSFSALAGLLKREAFIPIWSTQAPMRLHACLVRGMDDYRDLVSAALALFCAGLMLVAGHLLIEWHARSTDPGIGIEAPKRDGAPAPLISNGSPPDTRMIELPAEIRRKRAA
ncbi:hypothetical protein DAA61_03360 [Bradyrhizobium sp. WBAH33]|nr:hypothetical protein DAA61_03360 [Bradyrhizobium sp. WBAH33]QCK02403.1 hypothetical protein DAB18_03410 [Bradyrhizobium sp. WBAH41]